MSWGDVRGWAPVVVAVCALGVALMSARWSHGMFRTAADAAQRAEDARREASERAQAERVAAWPISEKETFQKAIARGVVGAAIRNASPMPIYNVAIVYRDVGAGWTATRNLHIVAPSDEPHIVAGFDFEDATGPPDAERVNPDGSVKLLPSAEMRVEIRFADAIGRRWSRRDNGVLVPMSAESAPAVPEPPPLSPPTRPVAAAGEGARVTRA